MPTLFKGTIVIITFLDLKNNNNSYQIVTKICSLFLILQCGQLVGWLAGVKLAVPASWAVS